MALQQVIPLQINAYHIISLLSTNGADVDTRAGVDASGRFVEVIKAVGFVNRCDPADVEGVGASWRSKELWHGMIVDLETMLPCIPHPHAPNKAACQSSSTASPCSVCPGTLQQARVGPVVRWWHGAGTVPARPSSPRFHDVGLLGNEPRRCVRACLCTRSDCDGFTNLAKSSSSSVRTLRRLVFCSRICLLRRPFGSSCHVDPPRSVLRSTGGGAKMLAAQRALPWQDVTS